MYILTQSFNQSRSPPNIQHTCFIFSRIIYTCSKKNPWQGPNFESSYSDQSDVETGSACGKLFLPPSTLAKLFSTQVQRGSNMNRTDVARFTHKQSRSYLNHLVHSENEFRQEVPPRKYFQQQIHSENYFPREVNSRNDFHHEVHSGDGSSHVLTYARDDELCVLRIKPKVSAPCRWIAFSQVAYVAEFMKLFATKTPHIQHNYTLSANQWYRLAGKCGWFPIHMFSVFTPPIHTDYT